MLANANQDSGDAYINISNLRLDGNVANQTEQFSVVVMKSVTYSTFDNLDVQGGRRNSGFPNGTWGEGIVLIHSHFNQILGGRYHHNNYDGIKLRSSNWNRIVAPLCDENGRAGIQISFYSPTGPPYNVGENVESEGSNHNTITNAVAIHSTGVPHSSSPVTSGIYIHTGYRNTITGLQAHGIRQGIGVYGGASDNEFNGGMIRINHGGIGYASIDIEGGPGNLDRNSFKGITCRGLSGANGRHLRVDHGTLNRFENCYFTIGDGTGTWTADLLAGATDTLIQMCFINGAVSDLGTNTQRVQPTTGRRLICGTVCQAGRRKRRPVDRRRGTPFPC